MSAAQPNQFDAVFALSSTALCGPNLYLLLLEMQRKSKETKDPYYARFGRHRKRRVGRK